MEAIGCGATGPGDMVFPFKFKRRANGEEDITVTILFCGICRSDLHAIRNDHEDTVYPLVPGHEIVGEVTDVGLKVTKFKIGDKVGVGCIANSCRACPSCNQDAENYCPRAIRTYNAVDYDGNRTYGGYSDCIVVNEHYAVRMPDGLPLHRAAPLLCAGITVYTALRHFGLASPVVHVAVVGLGGLGHLAVKFAKAFGAMVTVISETIPKKEDAVEQLGADACVLKWEYHHLQALMGSFDGILYTRPCDDSLLSLLSLLKTDGKLIVLGTPSKDYQFYLHRSHLSMGAPERQPDGSYSVLMGSKIIAGSRGGGMKETQEMIDFAAEHEIMPDVEVIEMNSLNEAMNNLISRDVRYRYVINVAKAFM